MRVLGIIPARGGSKGVPRKNIKLLCGKPLLAYTIESALQAKYLTRTIVSTEDDEIASVARHFGGDVPFMRPAELAEDDTPTLPVIMHAVKTLQQEGETFDAICLLQPTNPIRRPEDIDGCIDLLDKSGADSVVSILPVPDTFNPKWVYWMSADKRLALSTGDTEPIPRRQDLPAAYHRDGSVYVTRLDTLLSSESLYGKNILGFPIDRDHSMNIDTQEDWERALILVGGLPGAGVSAPA